MFQTKEKKKKMRKIAYTPNYFIQMRISHPYSYNFVKVKKTNTFDSRGEENKIKNTIRIKIKSKTNPH